MSVRSPTAGTWSSSQWRPDNEFETDRCAATVQHRSGGHRGLMTARLALPETAARELKRLPVLAARASVPVRLEFQILSLNPGLRQRCVAPDVWPTLGVVA